uniref:TLC domain-containing protein n=1 Tax=viral metagenome TaxID=1070528 RepID=A0A6C0JWG2_9ZZZZ
MNLLVNLFVSLIHFILAYGIFISILISNDFKLLISILVIMLLVKISFSVFGRCILTLYEYNSYFATTSKLLTNTLTHDINDKTGEEILINIGLLIILNKLLFLTFYKYYMYK